MFNHEISFDNEFAEIPVVQGEPGLAEGPHLFILVAKPKISPAGDIEKLTVIDEDGNALDKVVPTFTLNLYCIDNGKIEIIGVADANKKLVDVKFNIPASIKGLRHVEFMNDNKLKMQWVKNKLAETLDCKTATKHLSYDKLQGLIVFGEVKRNTYKDKNGVEKSNLRIDFLSKNPLSKHTYTIKQLEVNGKLEPVSINISTVPVAKAFELDSIYEERRTAAKNKDNSSFSPEEYSSTNSENKEAAPW